MQQDAVRMATVEALNTEDMRTWAVSKLVGHVDHVVEIVLMLEK